MPVPKLRNRAFGRTILCPIPDDLQEKVDALKALQAETAAELAALLPAVLDRAFKGEL